MSNNVKWLLIGAGDIAGKRVAEAIANSANSELIGVCDIVGEIKGPRYIFFQSSYLLCPQ